MRFRAAVLRRVGEPLQIEAVDLASLGPGDVLIRNHASGLCHTDLEVMQGSQVYPLPIVLGHEGAGEMRSASIPPGASGLLMRSSPTRMRSRRLNP